MFVRDTEQPACVTGLETAGITIEHQDGIGLVKPLVAFLSVGQVESFQRSDVLVHYSY